MNDDLTIEDYFDLLAEAVEWYDKDEDLELLPLLAVEIDYYDRRLQWLLFGVNEFAKVEML